MFYIRYCEHLTWFSKRNLVFYSRVFIKSDARETLSQTFCFIIGYPPYQHGRPVFICLYWNSIVDIREYHSLNREFTHFLPKVLTNPIFRFQDHWFFITISFFVLIFFEKSESYLNFCKLTKKNNLLILLYCN